MKAFAFFGEAQDWLTWMCQTFTKWILKQWFTRMMIAIVVCNLINHLSAFSDAISATARLNRRAKSTAKRCVEGGKRYMRVVRSLPYLCCVYTMVCASYMIQFTKAAIISTAVGTVDALASSCGNVFYDLVVDPLS